MRGRETSRGATGKTPQALLLAMLVIPGSALVPHPATDADASARGLVGAHIHSRWLGPSSPLDSETLAAIVHDARLGWVTFGAPVGLVPWGEASRAAEELLRAIAPLPAAVQFNTLRLAADRQSTEGLREAFAVWAPAMEPHENVRLVVGPNEPLTKGHGFSPDRAEQRIRAEYEAWHEVSRLPFCHKFTNPHINPPGMDWARMEELWASAQDAICYDWYASNKDSLATLERLHALGQRLQKPVYVLEAAIPRNDPALLAQLAARVDGLSLYQMLASPGGEDERLGAFLVEPGGVRERAPGAMLRSFASMQGPP